MCASLHHARINFLDNPTIEHDYDIAGQRLQDRARFTIAGVTTLDYQHDAKGRLDWVKQWTQTVGNAVKRKYVDFAYKGLNQLTDIDRDYIRRLTSLSHSKGLIVLADYDYTYDAHHRITAIDEVFSNATWNENHDYTYDDTDQLKTADHTVQSDEAYNYDKNGNRTGSQTHLGSTNSSTTAANNRITSDGVYNYTYDAEGNRLTRTHISSGKVDEYTWDHRNRLIKVTLKNAPGVTHSTVEYRYDQNNLLLRRIETPHAAGIPNLNAQKTDVYVHDGQHIVLVFSKTGTGALTLTNRFLWGPEQDMLLADDRVTSLSSVGTTYWVLADHLGNVRDLATYNSTTDTTTVAKHRNWDAFGNLTFDSASTTIIGIGWSGKLYDITVSLQYNINRWYDPFAGKWISEDPIGFHGGDGNLNRYVENGATHRTDPSGLRSPNADEQRHITALQSRITELRAPNKTAVCELGSLV